MLGFFLGVGLVGLSIYQRRSSTKPIAVDGDATIPQKDSQNSSGAITDSDDPSIGKDDSGTLLHEPSTTQSTEWIIDPALAISYDRNGYSEDEPFFPTGITGQNHFPHDWPTLESAPKFVELEPQPDNEFDCWAIRVIHDGRQIGWVKSSVAYWLAPYVHLMRKGGSRCLVPLTEPSMHGRYDEASDTVSEVVRLGVMILPKAELRRNLFPPTLLFPELDLVWNALSEAEREQVRADGFRLDEHTGDRFTKLGRKLTSYPFAYAADDDSLIAEYLTWYRRKMHSYTKDRFRAERNLGICEAVANGRTYREVAETCGLTAGSVGAIKRKGENLEVLLGWKEVVSTIPAGNAELAHFVIVRHF